jgi:hypothetical protein
MLYKKIVFIEFEVLSSFTPNLAADITLQTSFIKISSATQNLMGLEVYIDRQTDFMVIE